MCGAVCVYTSAVNMCEYDICAVVGTRRHDGVTVKVRTLAGLGHRLKTLSPCTNWLSKRREMTPAWRLLESHQHRRPQAVDGEVGTNRTEFKSRQMSPKGSRAAAFPDALSGPLRHLIVGDRDGRRSR